MENKSLQVVDTLLRRKKKKQGKSRNGTLNNTTRKGGKKQCQDFRSKVNGQNLKRKWFNTLGSTTWRGRDNAAEL